MLRTNKQAYAKANKQWLADKANESGVKPLPKGLLYKIIESGDPAGKHPAPHNVVTVHYTGRTIDGRTFDSSIGDVPPAMRLSDLIEGWIIALQQMRPGDKWELYIPAELGYGKFSQPGIPANSTLIFEIQLIAIA